MRVLLDECVPRKLKNELAGHDVRTVPEMGWAGKRNSELLQLATGQFDILLTVDRRFAYQKNISGLQIAILLLTARTNRFADLQPLMPKVQSALANVQTGQVTHIRA